MGKIETSAQYQEWVEKAIERYTEVTKLISNNTEVTPESVNYALASYTHTMLALIAEYQRVKLEHMDLEEDYKRWYDEKFELAKRAVLAEASSTGSKTKPALKEYETRLRNDNRQEYDIWRERLKIADAKVRFMLRILDTFKRFDSILMSLSNNMRAEMKVLDFRNRYNDGPKRRQPPIKRRYIVEDENQ